ncbi:MAG: hypothetical protein GY753_06720 [Gammaproteobacteria bacterium]|nr:hypothetical protein [Gammaproteobacteria bacterium]
MAALFATTGTISGIVGILLCAIAGIVRLTGSYFLLGYQANTLLVVGIAFLAVACFIKLEQLTRQRP